MRSAVIVIGCSYGDEGKGLAAAWAARRMDGPCLNVLINGGAQRGHTVDFPDGRRHVFHHFGAAALEGAVSCADADFIVNPFLFVQERAELEKEFGARPRLLISSSCRVSTPWDMMLNQIIEENRGAKRHGSCGLGIQETRLRYLNTDWALRFGALGALSRQAYFDYCRRLAEEYIPARLKALGMAADPAWQNALAREELFQAAWLDLQEMLAAAETYTDWPALASSYPSLLFEAGQGLALDAENTADFPHLTPSRTTSLVSARRISALPGETRTEILYVTRSYLTRHGAGPLPTQCRREAINPAMLDRTNLPNPHQQTLRYGLFDGPAILSRVQKDLKAAREVLPKAASAALVTHLNETAGRLCGNMALPDFLSHFDRAYLSDCPWDAGPAG
ncbi:MAG: adenylosuccinate synthetase [Clostridia bacterium]|nr:adenylosuccinate synthetase [Clostridia bacterium]